MYLKLINLSRNSLYKVKFAILVKNIY